MHQTAKPEQRYFTGLSMTGITIKRFLHCIIILWIHIAQIQAQLLNETFLEDSPIVKTQYGQLEGTVLEATNGRNYYAFRGIPYGKAGIRFQAPEPLDSSWTGTLDVTKESPVCIEYDITTPNKIKGEENCLHLNVYTPKLPSGGDDDDNFYLMPVMVFINGDEFQLEDASSTTFGPQRFMNKDVVLVVPHYRVGVFGFLSTGDDVVTGNAGLLDQVLALKWVKDNIGEFGGNSEKVTLFGQDAGAISVTLHLLSPLSKGLFRSAIAQSGSALCPFAMQPDPLQNAESIADSLGCPTRDSKDINECLSLEDPKSIIRAANTTEVYNDYSMAPVVEDPTSGHFLTEEPYDIFNQGTFNKVPIVIGFTQDEAAYIMDDSRISDLFIAAKTKDDFRNDIFPFLVSKVTELDINDTHVLTALFEEYFGQVNFDNVTELMLTGIQFISDAVYKSCIDFTARLLTKARVPVYAYVFDFASEYSAYSNYTSHFDVIHGSELNYLFDIDNSGKMNLLMSDEDKSLSEKLLTLWINFANTSSPVLGDSNFTWELSQPDQVKYLKLTQTPKMEDKYLFHKMNFWTNILQRHFETTS